MLIDKFKKAVLEGRTSFYSPPRTDLEKKIFCEKMRDIYGSYNVKVKGLRNLRKEKLKKLFGRH